MGGPGNGIGQTVLHRMAGCAVVLGALYLYVFWVTDPRLLLHSQSPAFFESWAELSQCLRSWPGGLIEYVSAGLTQTYALPWLGAAVITLGFGLVWGLAELLAGQVGGSAAVRGWGFVPAMCLLALLNRYTLALEAIISLAAALLLAWTYARLNLRWRSVRVIAALALCGGLYAVGGAVSVLLAGLCALVEVLARRSVISGAIIAAAGAAMPYLAGTYVYHVGPRDAWMRATALEYDFSPPWASIALYASLPLGLVLASGWPLRVIRRRWPARQAVTVDEKPRREGRKGSKQPDPLSPPTPRLRSGLVRWDRGGFPRLRFGLVPWHKVAILAVGAMVGWLSFDGERSAILSIDYHVRARRWEQALASAEPLRWSGAVPGRQTDERLAAISFGFHFPAEAQAPAPLLPSFNVAIHDINLALAETGRLLDCMFEYPQRMGASVVRLLPDDTGAYVAHSYNPDMLLELGDVNEAERLACEGLANVGPRPWLLERLVWVNVLKDRPEAARTCLNRMALDPRARAWSQAIRRELDQDPSLSDQAVVRQARSRMFRRDHVGHLPMDPDEEMLRYLLVANPHNRLAFDYLTAHYLLTLQDDKAAENLRHLGEFGYTRVPRHCEESLLLRAKLKGQTADFRRFPIRPETLRRFEAFTQELDELGGPGGADNVAIRDALVGRYGDTYWFYALFGNTFFRPEHAIATSRPGEGS